jgi:hypothetical protein
MRIVFPFPEFKNVVLPSSPAGDLLVLPRGEKRFKALSLPTVSAYIPARLMG